MFQCWSGSPYYLYNRCYFQVQFIAVWTHCSKGCHCLHVTNAPKAHIHKDQYPKNNNTICKLHALCMCWCVSAPRVLYYIVVATLENPTGYPFFCVSHYPIQIYRKGRSPWARRHSCSNWWQKYLNSNGFILVLRPENQLYECQSTSSWFFVACVCGYEFTSA